MTLGEKTNTALVSLYFRGLYSSKLFTVTTKKLMQSLKNPVFVLKLTLASESNKDISPLILTSLLLPYY